MDREFWTLVGVLFAIAASLATAASHIWNVFGGVSNLRHGRAKDLKSEIDKRLSDMSNAHEASQKGVNGSLLVLQNRVAENYEEFLRFRTEVAQELATKEDLDKTEARLSKRIDDKAEAILARLPDPRR